METSTEIPNGDMTLAVENVSRAFFDVDNEERQYNGIRVMDRMIRLITFLSN